MNNSNPEEAPRDARLGRGSVRPSRGACLTQHTVREIQYATHPLHQAIGQVLDLSRSSLPPERQAACVLIKDPACLNGPTPHYVRVPQHIPLFCSTQKGNDTEYCNVDALILLEGKIKVIVEI